MLPPIGHCVFVASPTGLAIRQGEDLPSQHVLFDSVEVTVSSPIRIAPYGRRTVPQLTSQAVAKIFPGVEWPITSCSLVVDIHDSGAARLTASLEDGIPAKNSFPDTIAFFVRAPDPNVAERIARRYATALFADLRSSTGQYWIGRTAEFESQAIGSFPLLPSNRLGQPTVRSPSFYVSDLDMKPVTRALWRGAVERVAAGIEPDILLSMISDFDHFRASAMMDTATIQGCSVIEIARNLTLDRNGKRIANLKGNSTDLVKHLSVGFGELFGRNLLNEEPGLFNFVKSLWKVRGHLAHGHRVSRIAALAQDVAEVEDQTGRKIRRVINWLASV